jgi:uncharacterized protein
MDHVIIVAVVVAVFAVVQSVFGMGLLVFGTPTLLLLGLPFANALGWLLPASVAISAIQVFGNAELAKAEWRGVRPLFCIVPLVIALALVLTFDLHAKIDPVVGTMLVTASAIRLNATLQQQLAAFIARAERVYLALMGLLHGFTNMGGAFLSVYASAIHRDKYAVRATVSGYYLAFGVFQIATIALLKPEVLGGQSLAAAAISTTIYWLIGRFLFSRASPQIYERAITGFIAFYGVAVLVKATL